MATNRTTVKPILSKKIKPKLIPGLTPKQALARVGKPLIKVKVPSSFIAQTADAVKATAGIKQTITTNNPSNKNESYKKIIKQAEAKLNQALLIEKLKDDIKEYKAIIKLQKQTIAIINKTSREKDSFIKKLEKIIAQKNAPSKK
jgi:hypothetical protein